MGARRILVLSDLWLPFPGGAERLIYNVARDLMHRGHHVDALTGYETPKWFDGPLVVRTDIPLDAEGWSIIAAVIEGAAPDVILTHHIYASTFAPQLAELGLPIVRLHYNGPRPDGAAIVVHISEHVARQAGAMGYDLVLHPWAGDDVVADEHGDAIGFVKPYPHKGAELLYRIADRMRDRRFVVLRGEWPTLEEVHLDAPNVEHLAPVDDMRDFYRRVRLVLMPSLSEDAGTVAQEATANGLPCISSDRGGLIETNAGGIRLSPELDQLEHWVASIRYLDHADHYRDVVRSQRDALPDPEPVLAELSDRIGQL